MKRTKCPEIISLSGYTIPMFGSNRILPYGNLEITDGETVKICSIKDEDNSPWQYILFAGKRFRVRNAGRLYSPRYVIVGSIEDCKSLFDEASIRYQIVGKSCLLAFTEGENTRVEDCGAPLGYYKINGKVQCFREWIHEVVKARNLAGKEDNGEHK